MTHATDVDGVHAGVQPPNASARKPASPKATPAKASCTVCARSDVAGINEALMAGRSASSVSISFFGSRNSKDALTRHTRKCLGLLDHKAAQSRRSAASRRLERALNGVRMEKVSLGSAAAILDQHERRYLMLSEIVEQARIQRDPRTAIAADTLRGSILGDAAKLQGFDKSASPLVNFHLELVRTKIAALSDEQLDRMIAGDILPELIDVNNIHALPARDAT